MTNVVYKRSEFLVFSIIIMKTGENFFGWALNKGITCTNIEQGDRNSTNQSGNGLPGAFIDTKI